MIALAVLGGRGGGEGHGFIIDCGNGSWGSLRGGEEGGRGCFRAGHAWTDGIREGAG